MLHIIQSIETKLQALAAKAKSGVAHTEAECAALLAHFEDLGGFLKAANVAPAPGAATAPSPEAPATPTA